jgi:pimeloyl-ACP methyl ester carboxylesterase
MLSAFGGGQVLGARHGRPPARVVALHGWERTHADFDRVLEGLDAIAPDLPGFGATAPPDEAWGSPEYAEALIPVLEAEGRPVVLVGHSFGGRVALILAAARPDLVDALILTGVPLLRPAGFIAPKPSRSLRLAKALNRLGLVSEARLERRRRRSGSPDYQRATGVLRGVFVRVVNETDDGTYVRALGAVECPIELIWGENDTAATVAVAEEAAALAPGSKLTRLVGVGHLTPTEAPDELRAAVERHLT